MWDRIKKVGIFFFCLLMFMIGIIFMVVPFTIDSYTNQEWTVDHTYSSKGLYFGLDYYVVSEGEKQRGISKEEIYKLRNGDAYIATKKGAIKNTFLISLIAIPFGAFILWIVWVLLSEEVFVNTKWMQKIHQRRQKQQKRYKLHRIGKFFGESIIIMTLIATIVIYSLIGKNIFYKINPTMTTTTWAEIMDKEKEHGMKGRTTYTFTMQYEDQPGTTYETEKDVSSITYYKYEEGLYVPINYRTKNPYDTFIRPSTFTEALKEMMSVLLKVDSIALLILIYIDYFFIKRYIKMWKQR